VHSGAVAACTPQQLAAAMVGEGAAQAPAATLLADGGQPTLASAPAGESTPPVLLVQDLVVRGDRGEPAVRGLSLSVRAGQIVGVAGVSGNGQRELMEALVGQRARESGSVRVAGQPYTGTRVQNRRLQVRALPEEPLRNACVPDLSVAANIGLRNFDEPPAARAGWLHRGRLRQRARELIAAYGVKTQGENAAIRSLSGGNVQRAVLARELSGDAALLLVSNPVFGLDFAAVAEIHARLLVARGRGAAVLLLSEDLDELLELSDRIVVMSEGRIVHETDAARADRQTLGAMMGGMK
jgi:simple sugar transport system ATP-binding protein